MSSIHELLSEQFYRWEKRGRGWHVFDVPTTPEPPFLPFHINLQDPSIIDDGRRQTFLTAFIEKISGALGGNPLGPVLTPQNHDEPEPQYLERDDLVEFQPFPAEKLDVSSDVFQHFLRTISLCREPLAFELLGTENKVLAQFALHPGDGAIFRRQSRAFFPELNLIEHQGFLEEAWSYATGGEVLAVDFGLAREFMFPLAIGKLDHFVGIVGALSDLQPGEFALYQVLFQPTSNPWSDEIRRSVTHEDGKPFFVNAPELVRAAETKTETSIYAAVVRVLVRADDYNRVLQLASDLAASLRVFSKTDGNELIPLQNDSYRFEDHIEDVLRRQTRRAGMLLNTEELLGFVHVPSSAIRSPAFERQTARSKAAPAIVQQSTGLLVGENKHAGKTVSVRLSPEQRVRHCHIIGASGTGKSTLLYNLIKQDIENGEGIAVLDPHGDLVDKILGTIPTTRIEDVVLVDPSDEEYAVGFNILSAHTDHEKNLLASDLVAVFQRLSTSWGDQMQSVLQNAILAFLDSPKRGTLADLRRFLIEPDFRSAFLKSVSDPNVLYYWQKGFAQLSGNKSIGPVLTRLEMLLAQRPIAQMVSQPENRLDFGQIMDGGKILLAKLPEGLLGRENSFLLGTLLISKFQQLAMARQAKKIELRRNFWIYCDEFANFISPSMAEILSGARKYRIGLTLAHHDLHQLQRSAEVASAVMTHPFTRIVFRIGDEDARKISDGFASFEAQDFKNLETGQAIARVERSNFDFNLAIPIPNSIGETEAATKRSEVITASRNKFGTPRHAVEAMLRESWNVQQRVIEPIPPKPNVDEPLTRPSVSHSSTKSPLPAAIPLSSPTVAPWETNSVETDKKKTLPSSAIVRDLGKGGEQHRAIQDRIKKAAQDLGFHTVTEKPITNELGSIDVLIEVPGESIACEISISTTIDHEIGNIRKCLKAGHRKIAIICLTDDRLHKIKAAAVGSLGAEVASACHYFKPDDFIEYLKNLQGAPPKQRPVAEMRRGYRIKRSAAALSEEEHALKEGAAIKAIATVMQRKK